ncbi:MFS transporter [Stygiolobus caldivivus]|uniref:MFS transporter n=1 Tax=Stygiolobus caldivivus TaxID=2824673 RepID=A0A8D5U4Z9_9CREN|nr:MFS transporter [Stygiolobus caldivivus]BCU69372.1 MFS transporter [Stygiolobus caldivivus]
MSNNPFKGIDSLKLTFNHIKIWYTAGMGFFTDAYDLLIISYIIATFTDSYKYYGLSMPGFTDYLTGPSADFWTGLLASSAIITAILGQLIFGFLGDKLGRKSVYGIEASLLTIGALLSAFSWNLPSLIFFRSIMGLGIGGDYPISATIMSEYANVKDRGKLIALVFSNQALGSVAALAIGVISASVFTPDIAWRVMAGVGAIPAATVIYLRRKVPETPRYSLLVKGDHEEAKKAAKFLGTDIEASSNVKSGMRGIGEFLSSYLPILIGTAGTWFILDIAFYGTGVYSSSALAPVFGSPFPSKSAMLTLGEFQSDLAKALFLGGVPFLVGFPGYFTAVALLDRLGRKWIQAQGFIAMAIIYAIVSSVMIVKGTKVIGFTIAPTLAFIIYSLSYFFIDFGPNTTTFVIPAEVYPTKYRTTGHGISAASGKVGAAITTYLFPVLIAGIGIKEIMIMLAILSVIGAALTFAFVPEPKLKSLEEASREKLEVSQ